MGVCSMGNDNMKEIYRTLQTSQEKYIYFLLTAAIAAIGFATTQTQSLQLSFSQIPLGISVLCWGISIFSGLINREYYNSTLFANYNLIKVQIGEHPLTGINPELIEVGSEGIKQAMESNSSKVNIYGHLQTIMFFMGAVFYVLWHIYEMYIRSTS